MSHFFENEVGIDYTIILVDNHSEQNEYELLKSYCQSHYLMCVCYDEQQARNGGEVDTERKLLSIDSQDKIVLIRNSDNLGFAAGNNVALDYVEKLGYKYVLLLNNDTEIAENAISKLFSFALEHSQFTAFVPQIRLFDPSNRIWNCGGKLLGMVLVSIIILMNIYRMYLRRDIKKLIMQQVVHFFLI